MLRKLSMGPARHQPQANNLWQIIPRLRQQPGPGPGRLGFGLGGNQGGGGGWVGARGQAGPGLVSAGGVVGGEVRPGAWVAWPWPGQGLQRQFCYNRGALYFKRYLHVFLLREGLPRHAASVAVCRLGLEVWPRHASRSDHLCTHGGIMDVAQTRQGNFVTTGTILVFWSND